MNQKLLYRLKAWRTMQAQKEGVELFRILPNVTLEEIARVIPRTSAEFLNIKGIKDGRWKKYGALLLAITEDAAAIDGRNEISNPEAASLFDEANDVNAMLSDQSTDSAPEIPGQRTLYTVSSFLDALNVLFGEMTVRVKGEISSVDTRDKTTYFTLKDSLDGSIMSCLIFRYQYDVSGIQLAIGQEVIAEGVPGVWKPTGRLSLKVQSIEVSGEGALQKAYNDLKRKLEKEGLFALEKKRNIPVFPERIALITSNQGAAIGDFMMNLGKHGFKVSLLSTNVEGKNAVLDLIEAVRFFNRHSEKYDVLVVIRGGGSLESLQAFNNEALVRAVAASKIPTLCGIGHEKDVSLVALTGDIMVSTPTATARFLRESFEKADTLLMQCEQKLFGRFEMMLRSVRKECEEASYFLLRQLQEVKDEYVRVRHSFVRSIESVQFSIRNKHTLFVQWQKTIVNKYVFQLKYVRDKVGYNETRLATHDPKRLLRLGYSLVMKNEKLVRSIRDVQTGDTVRVTFVDGCVDTEVKNLWRTDSV